MNHVERDHTASDEVPHLRVIDNAPRFAMLWESVLFDPELSANAKVVYAVLQRMAHECDGVLDPSQADIAERAGFRKRQTISSCLTQLEQRGHIKRTHRSEWETDIIELVAPASSRVRETDIPVRETDNHRVRQTDNDVRETDTYPVRETDNALSAKRTSYIGRENIERYRERITPLNAADAPTESPPNETPYALWAAFCSAAGQDIRAATQREKGYSLKAAQRLLADGVSIAEVRAYVAYRLSQTWRNDPLSMGSVEKHIGAWRMAGKPVRDIPASPKPPFRSQADWNAPGQRNPDGTLKPIA